VLALGLGGFIAWSGRQLQIAAIQQAEHDLQIQAHVVAGVLGNAFEDLGEQRGGGPVRLAQLVRSYARTLDVQVVVLDSRLQVLTRSDDSTPLGDLARAPEVIAAQQGQSDHDRRYTAAGEERLFAAAPIGEDGHRPSGVAQISRPASSLNAEIGGIWLRLVSAGAIVALLCVLVSLALARRLALPIQELTATSDRLAAGDLTQRATPDGPEEIRKLGETFNKMVDRLEQMLVNQRAFVAYAAHELRSPLASVHLRIEMLETSRAQHDQTLTQRYIEQIKRDLDHLTQLIDQLLMLSALDEAQHPPFAPIDLAPLMYELADELRPGAQSAGLTWQVDVPDHLPEVQGNAGQLGMAIRNLLDNAIKYTPSGGSVSLTAGAEDGALAISVADTGVGMTDEQRAHVFDRFYRGEGVNASRRAGFGLGLALVQAIVKAHSGDVQISSAPGDGSTITIRLPRIASTTWPTPRSTGLRTSVGTAAR
jgi:two-component system, OmpR family, sensor kinase